MRYTKHEFYRSREWKRLREVVISERTDADGFVICDRCSKPILKKYDMILHHKVHLTDDNVNDATISLNPKNIEILHHDCHNKDHNRFGHSNYMNSARLVYIVYGAPCSGKTKWVHDHATDNDIVVDMDSIWQMISINERYIKPPRLTGTVFSIRDTLYDLIKHRSGKWASAYILTTAARKSERDRLKTRLRADKVVYIESSMEECMKRAENRPKEWITYIHDWFDKYDDG